MVGMEYRHHWPSPRLSKPEKMPPLLVLLLSVVCAAAGQLLLKAGTKGAEKLQDFFNPLLAGGFTLYIIGAVLWVYTLSKLPLSLVYPFTALTLVLVMIGAVFLFGETLKPLSILAMGLICTGIFCLALDHLAQASAQNEVVAKE